MKRNVVRNCHCHCVVYRRHVNCNTGSSGRFLKEIYYKKNDNSGNYVQIKIARFAN